MWISLGTAGLRVMVQVLDGTSPCVDLRRQLPSQRPPYLSQHPLHVVALLDQVQATCEPRHSLIHGNKRVWTGEQEQPHRSGMTQVREITAREPCHTQRAIQPLDESLLSTEHIDASIDCREPLVDERPALPHDRLETGPCDSPKRLGRQRRDAAQRVECRVTPPRRRPGAQHLP